MLCSNANKMPLLMRTIAPRISCDVDASKWKAVAFVYVWDFSPAFNWNGILDIFSPSTVAREKSRSILLLMPVHRLVFDITLCSPHRCWTHSELATLRLFKQWFGFSSTFFFRCCCYCCRGNQKKSLLIAFLLLYFIGLRCIFGIRLQYIQVINQFLHLGPKIVSFW